MKFSSCVAICPVSEVMVKSPSAASADSGGGTERFDTFRVFSPHMGKSQAAVGQITKIRKTELGGGQRLDGHVG
jgi:hypothetical protein